MISNAPMPTIPKVKRRSRSSRRLLWLLFLFFVTLLVILFFNSSLSRINTIQVSGLHYVSEEAIQKALGIEEGDHFFSVGQAELVERVRQLEPINSVTVEKRFPGLIKVEIKEYPEVAFRIANDQSIHVILANGLEVPLNNSVVLDKPILTGWLSEDKLFKQLSEVLSKIPSTYLHDISEIKPDPSEAYPGKIKMYTRSRYEVITTIDYLAEKVVYLDEIIYDLKAKNMTEGIITMLEADVHTPFEFEMEAKE